MKKFLLLLLLGGGSIIATAQSGAWTRISDYDTAPSAPVGKTNAVGLGIGSKGYVGTGATTNNGGFTNDVESYDPAADSWSAQMAFGGLARTSAAGFSIGTKGYIGTGALNGSPFYAQDFWAYDATTGTWSQIADYGGAGRWFAVGFSIGSLGYVGTGSNQNGDLGDFWAYDLAANTWTKKANFGGGTRYAAVGFSIGSKGYIGTGNDPQVNPTYYSDFWEYDPSTDAWTQKAPFGGGTRARASAFATASYGYIGLGNAGEASDGITWSGQKDLWQYDPTANAWTRQNDLPGVSRWSATSFSVNGLGYVGLGWSGAGFAIGNVQKDFWQYDPSATIVRSATGTYMSPSPCPSITGSAFSWETDDGGALVYGVNAGGNNLGAMCWGIDDLAAGSYRNTYGWFGGPTKAFGSYLTRNYVLTPAAEPTSNVTLRFYCTAQELSDFVSAFNSAYGTSYTQADIRIIRNDGTNQDLDLTNNSDNANDYTALTPTIGNYGNTNEYRYFEVRTSSLSEFAIALSSPSAPLAYSLLNFSAVYQSPSTLLSWQTAQEENTVAFQIQRSVNGQDFGTIGTVAAAGNSSTTLNYHFADGSAAQAGGSTLYYRLQETDMDGHMNYSPVAVVQIDASAAFAAYPNPVTDHVFIQIASAGAAKANLIVTDVAGRKIAMKALSLQQGNNTLYVGTSGWGPGMYYLELLTDGGKFKTKLLKQ